MVLPSTAIVYVVDPGAAPSSQTFTATVPETVALRFGLVMKTASAFVTVTV